MVSIEYRVTYMEGVNESPKLKAFHHFLLGRKISSLSNNVSDLEEQFLKILSSIQTNNKTEFGEIYDKKSKSNPNKDSPAPFVNDDYLIFCLIIAITKFSIDKTWIENIISIRNRNALTITFENILNENYSSTSNQAEVVLMFLHLCKQSLIDNNLLNLAYKNITENATLLESRNDFQILCAFIAYDIVIYQKEASEGSEITLLKKFKKNFTKRIEFLSIFLQTVFWFGLIYVVLKLSNYSPETFAYLNTNEPIFNIFGALGISVIGNQIPFIKKISQESLMILFGYPKEFLDTKNQTTDL